MDKEKLRPVIVGQITKKKAFFHKWFIKTFDDEPRNERPFALVELEDGTVQEVHAEHVKFTDRP